FDPAVAQLERLDRRISPSIVLLQRVEQPLHLRFDFRSVGVHVALPDAPIRTEGHRSYTNQNREVTPGLFLTVSSPDEACGANDRPHFLGGSRRGPLASFVRNAPPSHYFRDHIASIQRHTGFLTLISEIRKIAPG